MKNVKTIKDITKKQKKILLEYAFKGESFKDKSIFVAITDFFEVYTYDNDIGLLIFTTESNGSITLDCTISVFVDAVIENKIKRVMCGGEYLKTKDILKNAFKIFEGLEG